VDIARGTTRELVAVIGGVTKVIVEVEGQDRALGFAAVGDVSSGW
jgi:hypothetical protein